MSQQSIFSRLELTTTFTPPIQIAHRDRSYDTRSRALQALEPRTERIMRTLEGIPKGPTTNYYQCEIFPERLEVRIDVAVAKKSVPKDQALWQIAVSFANLASVRRRTIKTFFRSVWNFGEDQLLGVEHAVKLANRLESIIYTGLACVIAHWRRFRKTSDSSISASHEPYEADFHHNYCLCP